MTRLRRALGPIAGIWLVCQLGLVPVAPIVLGVGAAEERIECTCVHGEHATCPMHHRAALGSTICLMRSADNGGAAVLGSIVHFIGVLPELAQTLDQGSRRTIDRMATTPTSLRPSPPDPPPPRA